MARRLRKYKKITLPERFRLEDPADSGMDRGQYEARLFSRLDDGTYACAGHGGSPLFLRVLKESGDRLTCQLGDGTKIVYRLIPV